MTPSLLAIDVETTGLNPWKDQLLGCSICYRQPCGTLRSSYYPWHGEDVVQPFPWEWLADPTITKLGHNVRFDIKFLTVHGIPVQGPWEDTKLLAQLLNENRRLGLKPLALELLQRHPDLRRFADEYHSPVRYDLALQQHLKDLKLTKSDLGDARVNPDLVAAYCREDTENTWRLFEVLQGQITPALRQYYDEEMLPLEQVLLAMELRGTLIDPAHLDEADRQLQHYIATCTEQLQALVADELQMITGVLWDEERGKYKTAQKRDSVERPAFNWNSTRHKTMLFYEQLGLGNYVTDLTDAGKPSLKREVLRRAKLPEGSRLQQAVELQIRLQSYSKMQSAYVVGIRDRLHEGRIHGEYYQASQEDAGADDAGGTVTGRLSHRNPNLGNLPRSGADQTAEPHRYWAGAFAKDLFIPDPGHVFIDVDFSQIELRLAAHCSGDPAFLRAFRSGGDPHQDTATQLGITRQQAKTVNFLLIYGGSAWRLALQLGWNPRNDIELRKAEGIRNAFFAAHPELAQWLLSVKQQCRRDQQVTSLYGRVRRLPEVRHPDLGKQGHALKQGGNFVIQSVAASICKRAMLELHRQGYVLVNQIHDAITCQVPEAEADVALPRIIEIMCGVATLTVPLEADGGICRTFAG